MRYIAKLLLIVLTTASCQVDNLVGPSSQLATVGSNLLYFKKVYTTVDSDKKSHTYEEQIRHTFDQECRLIERSRELPVNSERTEYSYNKAGLLIQKKYYESWPNQPDRLMETYTYQYDSQGRLLSEKLVSFNGYVRKYEYNDDKKQVNVYLCSASGENCWTVGVRVNGTQIDPDFSTMRNGYVSSGPLGYNTYFYDTFNEKGNNVLSEIRETEGQKRLIFKRVTVYDTQPIVPSTVNESDFPGIPTNDFLRPSNNPLQTDEYRYDVTSGAVTSHLRTTSKIFYNEQGFPVRISSAETNMLTAKPTGGKADVTIAYGCSR